MICLLYLMKGGGRRSELQLHQMLLSLSVSCNCMSHLKQIQSRLLRHQISSPLILSKLLRFAAVSPNGNLRYAHSFFSYYSNITTTTNAFFYNTLIRGHVIKTPTPSSSSSISLFNSMRSRSISPDGFSFTFLLKACSRYSHHHHHHHPALGEDVHALALKSGSIDLHVRNAIIHLYASRALPDAARKALDEMPPTFPPDVVSWSGLLTAYVKAGDLDSARTLFDRSPVDWDVVSWTTMISGYAKSRRPKEASSLFRAMPMPPDEVTMVGVISACAAMGDLETGDGVHRYVEERGFGWMVSLRNALIDMYAKCGCLVRAKDVFDKTDNKSSISWNCLISAYATHGDADGAIALFRDMCSDENVRPDGVTCLAVLSACAHGGLVEEGRRLFDAMRRDGDGIGVEHYGCVVDMLGRAGRLEEAYDLVEGMPMESNDKVWGALLGACRIYGDLEMAERVVGKLMELKPDEGGYYVLLSSIYMDRGRQAEAAEVRQVMKERRAHKTPGCSSSSS